MLWEMQMKRPLVGCRAGSVVELRSSAQGVIPESQDRVPHRAPCMEPAAPSACVSASLSVSLMNKFLKNLNVFKDPSFLVQPKV